ncbi:Thioredoxin-like [Chryseobacterium sp. RU37D]|uniref:peroxiredoxin family protein n=1 Tax=Chryseobacterium sp. RU37D TaxID=1907397 RepID=UPI000954D3BC|nr:thioredoxin family protein [Chryseobacterium sp. RU37D]SIR02921.1 Thioredoxin-like [Chryseobacterium sp. RU37D]
MKKIIFLILSGLCCWLHAQKIDLYFPHFAGKTYDFIIFQGDKQQTIIQGKIPSNGKFSLIIPQEYAPYTGMSRWLITNDKDGGGLDMLVSGKDFSVSCSESIPTEQNIIYQGNEENRQLNELYEKQQNIFARHDAMLHAIASYSKTDKNYPVFQQEYQIQKQQYHDFQSSLSSSPTYEKQLVPIINITKGIGTEILDNEKERADNIASYIANDINFKVLYTSGYWTTVIASWVSIHTQVLKDPYRFVEDFAHISQRLEDKNQYKDFVGRTTYYLTQQGKDLYIGAIAPWVLASGKITSFEGSLAVYLKGAVGTHAPDLIFTKNIGRTEDNKPDVKTIKPSEFAVNGYEKTLLVFYESGCGHCEDLLRQLPENYESLKKKGIQIVSISADTDEKVFKSKIDELPWKQYAFCDLEGLKGPNFVNYAVIGTPTMVLIDESGKILLKSASLQEILEYK